MTPDGFRDLLTDLYPIAANARFGTLDDLAWRWRISPVLEYRLKACLVRMTWAPSMHGPSADIVETGSIFGIPYRVDPGLGDNEIRIEATVKED